MIPFNKPYQSGKETTYITEAVKSGKISGDGVFTKRCHDFFEKRFGFKKTLLTTSCTDALELAALLVNIQPGDEVIMPSYTFVSTANAFVLRGAKIRFVDSRPDHPGIDEDAIEAQINERTKVIAPVHYAGVASDMGKIMSLAKKYNLFVVEDAAQAIDSYYINEQGVRMPLGGIGDLGAFSFHETKNIISGEGGLIAINNPQFAGRAEILREKGTNRSSFFRGEVDKYGWVDLGSSFLPSDINAAFLYAQLEQMADIQQKRITLWNRYYERFEAFEKAGWLKRPVVPTFATNNGHMFYTITDSLDTRTRLIQSLKEKGVYSVFHYLSLHTSPFFAGQHYGADLPNSDRYTDCLLRLPLFYELELDQVDFIADQVEQFFRG